MDRKYILGCINIFVMFTLFVLLMIMLQYINSFSLLSLVIMSILFLFIFVLFIFMYFSSNNILYNIVMYVCFLINIIFGYMIIKTNINYDFVHNFINKNSYEEYYVLVLRKNTVYNNVSKLDEKNIGIISNDDMANILWKIDYNQIEYNSIEKAIFGIEGANVQSLIVNDKELQEIKVNNANFYGRLRIIERFRAPKK